MMRRVIFLVMLLSSAAPLVSSEASIEYQVKAVCVLNAAKFVTWPASSFGADGPLVIGVLGENPFGSILQNVVKGETVQQRRIVVRRVALAEAGSVHILFISQSERDRVAEILRSIGTASVLTVSEIDRFTQSGGMLRLGLSNGRIRLEINSGAAHASQLKIDAQFLLLARRAKSP